MLKVEAIKQRLDRHLLLFKKGWWHQVNGLTGQTKQKQMVFVSGVQRSGTNMLMDIVEGCLLTDVFHETDRRAYDDYELKPPATIRHLYEKSKAPHVVFKALCEGHALKEMLDSYDVAKGVWVYRSYGDVVNSMLKSFPSQAAVIQRLVDDPASNRWIGKGMSEATHELLKHYWHPAISDESAAALIWYLRNTLFFEQQLDEDERVSLVCYEDMVRHPDQLFPALGKSLGLVIPGKAYTGVFKSSISKEHSPQIEPQVRLLCDRMAARLEGACRFDDHSVAAARAESSAQKEGE